MTYSVIESINMSESTSKTVSKKVFVVYGRDRRAYAELQKFLNFIGVAERSFEDIANQDASPFVTKIVLSGIQSAGAVIVLFTPDELAVLYETANSSAGIRVPPVNSRWQARPNVIFEAGVAFGIDQEKTVIVALGPDVSGFSDIGGVHIVHLNDSNGKAALCDRLARILKTKLKKPSKGWNGHKESGEFDSCVQGRWQYYDEFASLERFLESRFLYPRKKLKKSAQRKKQQREAKSLLEVVTVVALKHKLDWDNQEPRRFIKLVKKSFDDRIADLAYWWLVVAGFFQFQDTKQWWISDKNWTYSVDYTKFAPRGLALLKKLVASAPKPTQ